MSLIDWGLLLVAGLRRRCRLLSRVAWPGASWEYGERAAGKTSLCAGIIKLKYILFSALFGLTADGRWTAVRNQPRLNRARPNPPHQNQPRPIHPHPNQARLNQPYPNQPSPKQARPNKPQSNKPQSSPSSPGLVHQAQSRHPQPKNPQTAQRARHRRRRITLFVLTIMTLGLLSGIGLAVGKGIGIAAAAVKHLLPDDAPLLVSTKVAPPKPVDISGPATPCPASSLTVEVQPDKQVVLPGEIVGFSISVTHTGRYPCLVNGGEENLRLRILDADDAVLWTSEHCPAAGHRDLLLGPDHSFTWERAWDGRVSVPGGCTEGQSFATGKTQVIASLVEVAASDSAPAILKLGAPEPPPAPPSPTPTASLSPSVSAAPSASPSSAPPAPAPSQSATPSSSAEPSASAAPEPYPAPTPSSQPPDAPPADSVPLDDTPAEVPSPDAADTDAG